MTNDNSYKNGVGTIRRFIGGIDGTTLIGIERTVEAPLGTLAPRPMPDPQTHRATTGRTHFLPCDPTLAENLLNRWGLKKEGFVSMESIIGAPCRYTESATGMLVRLDPMIG